MPIVYTLAATKRGTSTLHCGALPDTLHVFKRIQGWVSGTGGGISVKAGDKIVMAPSGVQKERMKPADMFVLDSAGRVPALLDAHAS